MATLKFQPMGPMPAWVFLGAAPNSLYILSSQWYTLSMSVVFDAKRFGGATLKASAWRSFGGQFYEECFLLIMCLLFVSEWRNTPEWTAIGKLTYPKRTLQFADKTHHR